MSSLGRKLQNVDRIESTLLSDCQIEIQSLHQIFVAWFRGDRALGELIAELKEHLSAEFSHVAPNGHLVQGRDVLIQYLTDKYGCYADRVFCIDVFHVKVLWSAGNKCLVSYEEWQSWQDESEECRSAASGDDTSIKDIVRDNSSNSNTVAGKGEGKQSQQQFGRLTSCLLERNLKNKSFRWIHVHETWMETEEPVLEESPQHKAVQEEEEADESVMTGPAPPGKTVGITSVSSSPFATANPLLQPRGYIEDDEDETELDEEILLTPTANNDPSGHTTDESSTSEQADKVAELKAIPGLCNMTPEERQFMENSQGILFFEDEDEDFVTSPQKASNVIANKATLSLDDMLEDMDSEKSDNDLAISNNNSSHAMLSLHSAADTSHKRHVSPRLEEFARPLKWEGSLVGISIAGFDIGTSQGPIADAGWYANIGRQLEKVAQPPEGNRKLALPEMVFPTAHVALEGHGLWMSWDATDALREWAEQHAEISLESRQAVNGVSILQTKDAALWEGREQHHHHRKKVKEAIFHYDWTYSTPFVGKLEGGAWLELDESGIDMSLLTNKNVPILFFDEIILYEDDLHDNGQVQFSIKLRTMPSCAYILTRLWVRVDSVLLRCRETRLLIDFFGLVPKIYRDVTWRECAWDELKRYGLPVAVREWSCEDSGETAEWNQLVQSLPLVELPDGILQHAVLEFGKVVNIVE